jgi:tRNA(Arg) A34 adenosine deaminase TadA
MSEEFESRVLRQIQRLRDGDLRRIEEEVSRKRIDWIRQAKLARGCVTPREAFETLFFQYMGLEREGLPVVAESDTEIVWLSRNRCPTLEACSRLRLDTRNVCRAAYEKSTQAFLSQLDPRLRFLRSYEEIRPYAPHCRESIVRVDFEAMIRIAIEEAELSRREGNKGYGAVVAMGNRVLARTHDTATTERDASLHAEVNALRMAGRALGGSNLSGAALFSSCEPCPMCSSLAVWSNVSAIIYGASIAETVALGKARIRIAAEEVVAKSPVAVEVIGGVLREECLALYR